ncbi:putative methylesterase 12, chloroplastic [Carex rostrata]
MGNGFTCMPGKDPGRGGNGTGRSKRVPGSWRKRGMSEEDEMLHRQALAIARQQLSQRFDGSISRRVDGSMSRRIGAGGGNGSVSSRRRDLPDSLKQPTIILENLETKKIVLIHGEGFGAWCWYKTMSMLEEAGLEPVALDLTGSGIDNTDINNITTLEEYSKPLLNYLNALGEGEKVIVVAHSCGGACLSFAMENFPGKISKAVFLTATMVKDGQRPFDVFTQELASADILLQESQFLLYGNGKEKPPTGLKFDKQQIKALYFNQTPTKDIALATVSMRPIPLAPIMETISLTPEKYGKVRRFYIQTLEDMMLSADVQEKLVRESPPHGIFKIKGGDHCPFFSKPQALNKILLEVAQIQ